MKGSIMKNVHFALNPFAIDPKAHSKQFSLTCPEPTLTVQADAVQADINFIVNQFIDTGMLPYGNQIPEFADYTDIPSDYQSALNFINQANDVFMEYPAQIRSKFDNDPHKFLEFVRDPANVEKAKAYGFYGSLSADGLPISDNGSSSNDEPGA